MFERLGARRIDADRFGHQELEREEVRRQVRRRWGASLFTPGGELDRKRLAKIVFAPPPEGVVERRALEAITHPGIVARIESALASNRRAKVPAVVLDAALLMEAGWIEYCDHLVFVDTPKEMRLRRTARHRGWSSEQHEAREQIQESLQKKRDIADYTIDNCVDSPPVFEQVRRCWNRMMGSELPPSPTP
jgi:dephospho-CoA kinase